MFTYKLKNNMQNELVAILRSDGAGIPLDTNNTDYQEYLKWLEEGNTPLPAEGTE